MALRRLRENSNLPTEGWSHWVRAMVRDLPARGQQHFERRRGRNVGFICRNVNGVFVNDGCGIYEWQARAPERNKVVYVGCTCRRRAGGIPDASLSDRIREYCVNGSHKRDLINDALRKGYELWVRVKRTGVNARATAERAENALLAKYDYAWNIRNNGAVRSILPWP